MAIIPSIIISYSITGLIRDELKSNINTQLIYAANSISVNINSKLKKSIEILELNKKIIENPNLGSNEKIAFLVSNVEKVDNLLSLKLIVKEKSDYVVAISSEKDFRKVGDKNIPLQNALEKISFVDYSMPDSGASSISTPYFNRTLETWTSIIILKVNIAGIDDSYLAATVDLREIAYDIENHYLNRIGVLFVADSSSHKFLSSKLLVDVPWKVIDDAKTLQKSQNKIQLINSYSDVNGGEVISCFSYPDIASWIVVANIKEKSAYATVNEALIFFLVFAGIGVLLSVLIAWIFSKHISRPIIQMSDVSNKIAAGNFDANVNYDAKDSIGVLNESLSKMGRQLKYDFKRIEEQKNQLEDYSKNLEKKVEQRTAELSESNKELKKAYQKVLELNEEKNEFLGIAAHDLKNPLFAVRSFAEIMREDENLSSDQKEDFLNEITKASNQMFFIVKNFLDVNTIEQGGFNLKTESVLVNSVINETVEQFQNDLAKKGIKMFVKGIENDLFINADRNLLIQVIQNLISNAIKFSPSNRNIFVSCNTLENGSVMEIRIKDEGPGFTDEDKKKVFGKFARLSARPTAGEHSTGLGLSIVKKLVELMGGRIKLVSEVGKGAEFILSFAKE